MRVLGNFFCQIPSVRNLWVSALILFSFIVQGCSLEASIGKIGESVSNILQEKAPARDVTPGSQQHLITSGGYRVQASVDFYEGTSQTVTSGGYKVQTNLQSTLFQEIK